MAFPDNGILDDFNRGDRTLNGDGIWAKGHISSASGVVDMDIVSNQAQPSGSESAGQARTVARYTRDANPVEAYVSIVQAIDGGLLVSESVYIELTATETNDVAGYQVSYLPNAAGLALTRLTPNANLGTVGSVPALTKIGLRHDVDGTLRAYYDAGAGWVEAITVVDDVHTFGHLGFANSGGYSTRPIYDDFGGGGDVFVPPIIDLAARELPALEMGASEAAIVMSGRERAAITMEAQE